MDPRNTHETKIWSYEGTMAQWLETHDSTRPTTFITLSGPNFILQNFNQGVIDGKFPDQLNEKTLVLSLKKETISIKSIIDREYLTLAFKNS